MHLMINGGWEPDRLDHWRGPGQVRLKASLWVTMSDAPSAHFVQPKRLNRVLHYARHVGPKATVKKIISRLKDERIAGRGCGLVFGRVLEADPDSGLALGQLVWAIVTAQIGPCSRPVCDLRWVSATLDPPAGLTHERALRFIDARHHVDWPQELARWSSWSSWSQHEPEGALSLLERCVALAKALDLTHAPTLTTQNTAPRTLAAATSPPSGRPQASLFGYGHYARTCIIPHIYKYFELRTIHELDPAVIPATRDAHISWDTGPWLSADERPHVVFIAGYHHTHAPVAIEALKAGACAIIEKPAVTTWAQLDELTALMAQGGRLWTGYHKRYEQERGWLEQDLELGSDDLPCDYHAIIYEPALPPGHWYRWPASGSAILSNACHWIEQFLSLNRYSQPTSWQVKRGASGALNLWIALANGASCSVSLSHQGSGFGGVRQLIEVRAKDRTARMIDGRAYEAWGPTRLLRKQQLRSQQGYAAMYRHLSEAALDPKQPGEPVEAFKTLNALLLSMDEAART